MPKYLNTLSPTKVSPELHQSVKQFADKHQLSMGAIVRLALTEYLEKRATGWSVIAEKD